MHASNEPGRTKTNFEFTTPAKALVCRLDVLILSYEIALNISPNPSISLSSNTLTASGVPSEPVIPVPPLSIMTSRFLVIIKEDVTALI